jgi:very-short-patch-repair endonuclease
LKGQESKVLLPLVFCRECGQEYYVVRRVESENAGFYFIEMQFNAALAEGDGEAGYLYLDEDSNWPDLDPEQLLDVVPDEWLETKKGKRVIKYSRRKHLPKVIYVSPEGVEGQGDLRALWIPASFKFCISCKIAYNARQKSDYGKLSTLGSEGRSTATTILALGVISRLKTDHQLSNEAKKLLSFTDNRQDASLQAGHFNDFVLVSLIRAALLGALKIAGPKGIRHEDLTNAVFDALSLSPDYYAQNPTVRFAARDAVDRALREVIGYHLFRDLRRGWRVVAPNLEQCGLLQVEYLSLMDVCSAEDIWGNSHSALVSATPDERFVVCRTLLDFIRRSLAINVDYLKGPYQEKIQQQSSQNLIEPWSIDEGEKLEQARIVYARQGGNNEGDTVINLSPRGGFGQYLRRANLFGSGLVAKTNDAEKIISDLLRILSDEAGILTKIPGPDHNGYQLSAGAILWCHGEGKEAFHDPIRVPQQPEDGLRTNEFFVKFYREATEQLIGLEAREHTAQVQADERIDRETRFRSGALPVLFCSPTMELGVDISDLNVVNLRNVPPTPANYAQRSGRAGRSGQPAFVYTYCATGSPHDSYYFKRAAQMVAGAVAPPQLDVANEDLVRSHIQAIWLSESGLDLGKSLKEVLDVTGDNPTLDILPSISTVLSSQIVRNKARQRAQLLLDTISNQLAEADWYSNEWLDRVLNAIPQQFENACQRWKGLYQAALDQMARQNMVRRDASRQQDWREAERLYNEAKQQLALLVETKNLAQSDFYSYRYFASEGFLPGYNFPRLPLSAYIPGRRGKKGREEFLSRPRFLAISEFGPRAFIYHEGSRYLINRVILPVDRDDEEGDSTLTRHAKVCDMCGYIHPLGKEPGPEKCDRCKAKLDRRYENLFRMQSVVGRRRDRINCDEEERFRLGYQIISGVRFAEYGGVRSRKMAELRSLSGELLVTLQYGQAATLWRMNVGWSRFKDREKQTGFFLDTERGYWAKDSRVVEDDEDDPISPKVKKVIPYVEDRRNCLLIEPAGDKDDTIIASLQAALKSAIQQEYNLEDNELAAEGLPSVGQRRIILLYEAAEGGAGILRRLVEDRKALPRVATRALELCHFEPTTGNDVKHAPKSKEDCAIACYDCLLSYYNQRDHEILNRHAIRDTLMTWQKSDMILSSGQLSRAQHLEALKRLCDSGLEKNWLDLLETHQLHLPSHAQHLIKECHTKPDFFYQEHSLVIYIDGPPHDFPERQERDKEQVTALQNHGFWILRFHHKDDWIKKLSEHSDVFGKMENRL